MTNEAKNALFIYDQDKVKVGAYITAHNTFLNWLSSKDKKSDDKGVIIEYLNDVKKGFPSFRVTRDLGYCKRRFKRVMSIASATDQKILVPESEVLTFFSDLKTKKVKAPKAPKVAKVATKVTPKVEAKPEVKPVTKKAEPKKVAPKTTKAPVKKAPVKAKTAPKKAVVKKTTKAK